MSETKSENIVWHDATVTRAQKEELFKQKGVVLWYTGFSASGKSTVWTLMSGFGSCAFMGFPTIISSRGSHSLCTLTRLTLWIPIYCNWSSVNV